MNNIICFLFYLVDVIKEFMFKGVCIEVGLGDFLCEYVNNDFEVVNFMFKYGLNFDLKKFYYFIEEYCIDIIL